MDLFSPDAVDAAIDHTYLLTFKSIKVASDAAMDCLARSEESGYERGIFNSRILLALIDIYKGQSDRTQIFISELMESTLAGVSEDALMRLNHLRALYFLHDGVYKEAFNAFVKCGNLAGRVGHKIFQILSANGKGVIKLDQLEFEDAFAYFDSVRTTFQQQDYPILYTLLTLNIGCALGGMKRFDESLEHLKRALEHSENQSAVILKSSVLDEMATVLIRQERYDEALPCLEEGYRISTELEHRAAVTELVYNYASLLLRLGQCDKAETLITGMGKKGERQIPLMLYHKVAGEIYEQRGELRKALDSCKEVHKIKEEIQGREVLQSVFRQEIAELEKQNNRLRLVSNIGQELVSTLDLGQIISLIYAQMNALMPVDHLSVGTLEGEMINIRFSLNAGKRVEPFSLHRDNANSFISYSVRTGREVFIRNVDEEYSLYIGKIVPFKANRDGYLRSLICIPLRHNGEVDGFLTVQSFKPYAYSSEDLDNLRALASYIGIAVRNAIQTDKMSELNKVLRYQSSTDSLTGVATRREAGSQCENILKVSRRNHFTTSVILIDLDHFKEINDRFGHSAGDEVLREFGAILKSWFQRPLDSTSRYGGEEFLVMAGNMSAANAARRIEALRQEFSSREFRFGDEVYNANFSCGIYSCRPEDDSVGYITQILSQADRYLYLAKKSGRKCTFLSDEPDKPAVKFIP